MIKKRIALVLGAGASMPFGFPSGKQLKDRILDELTNSSSSPMHQNLHSLGHEQAEIGDFTRALTLSGTYSVDEFLERRSAFLEIGKAAIAAALIPCEQEKRLFPGDDDNWYRYLLGKLDTDFDHFDDNHLSILTFNYDRSIEHFLFTAMLYKYGYSADETAKKLQSIPIIHLYGQLGNLPYFGENAVPYEPRIDEVKLRKCAAAIRIIHEPEPDDTRFTEARHCLEYADRICFLGFSYGYTNLHRLLSGCKKTNQEVCGSSFGLTTEECANISKKFVEHGFASPAKMPDFIPYKVLGFLRQYCALD